jgi:hypothetical protein
VHDARRSGLRERGLHAARQLVDLGEVARLVGVPLLAPPGHVAGEEAFGLAEVGEADRRGIRPVQAGEDVDQLVRHVPRVVEPERRELVDRADDPAVDPVHHVERRADHVDVVAERPRHRHRHARALERGDHAVLAAHVVCGLHHVAERRPPHDPRVGTVGHCVGEVRPAAGDQRRRQLRPGTVEVVREPAAERVEVEAFG